MTNFKFLLQNFQVTSVSFNSDTYDENVTEELETNFHITVSFSKDNNLAFAIKFDIYLGKPESKFNLNLKAVGHFLADKPIEEEFKQSPAFKINAPAIAFPYLRAFISTFTLNAGFKPIILPSFNFIQLYQEEEEKLRQSKIED